MGLLFLGGGKLGLNTSPSSIAALICAFFPKFPTHSADNRYHLQALRHLYVLAVEPRLLVPRCSETGKIIKCNLSLRYSDTIQYRGINLEMQAPILLPSLTILDSVAVADIEFWTTLFAKTDFDGWSTLSKILDSGGNMAVKRKVGANMGLTLQWSLGRDQLSKLSATPECSTYLSMFLFGCPSAWVSTLQCLLSSCLANSTLSLLPVWTSLLSPHNGFDTPRASLIVQQIQALISLARCTEGSVLHPELALSLLQKTNQKLNGSLDETSLGQAVVNHMNCKPSYLPLSSSRQLLASVFTLHSLSSPSKCQTTITSKNPLKLAMFLKKSPNPASLYRIIN